MNEERFKAAIAAFDRANAEDPNQEVVSSTARPRELVQAERFSDWLGRLEPSASEAVRLAVRCQHIRRWERPRSLYPEGRIGYLKWRKDLGRFHAETAAAILRAVGYDEALIARVGDLNLKRALTSDPEAQTVEDVLCLSFIEHELAAFAKKHPEQKIVEIIQKTWRKMSERAQALALQIPLSSELEAVVLEALKTG
jgi:hypothetical protein